MNFILFSLIAFLGGVVSLFSPCSGALLPLYFTFIFKDKTKILKYTFVFTLGVIIVALPTALGISFIFKLTQSLGPEIYKVISFIFFIAAILTLFGKNFKFPIKINSIHNINSKNIFIIGVFSGLSLGTCTGPVLGAIATLAATTNNMYFSSLVMLFYVLGIIFPLFIIATSAKKLDFLTNIFTKGKLFEFKIANKLFVIHSTNIVMSLLFLFLAWLFYFHQGSFGTIPLIQNSSLIDFAFDLQDKLVNLRY